MAETPAPAPRFAALHLWVLTAFAVAQPLFDLLSRQPEFLVAHQVERFGLLALTLALVVLLPVGPIALGWAGRRISPRAGRSVHLLQIALLVALIVLPVLGRLQAPPGLLLVLTALGIGALSAFYYAHLPTVRSFLSVLGPSIAIFPAVFLFSWPVRWLLLPPAASARAAVEVPGTAPVVLVVFDELSLPTLLGANGEIDGERFPHFAALAAGSTWFPHATTVADSTFYGLPAIVDGRYPAGRRLPTHEFYPETLFTLLADDYELTVYEHLTRLCPPALCGDSPITATWHAQAGSLLRDAFLLYLHHLLPHDLTGRLPEVDNHWRAFGRAAYDEDQAEIFERFSTALGRSGGERTFFFLHSMLPHFPWHYLPSGRTYDGMRILGVEEDRWRDDEVLRLQGLQRYLLQLMFVDRLLGRLLTTLEDSGLYDQTLLVVTADHGLSFQSGTHRRTLHEPTFADIMLVPLFFKLPGQRQGRRCERPATTIDILPSIADLLGVDELPWPVAGHSLFAEAFPPRDEKIAYRSLQQLGDRFSFPASAFRDRLEMPEPLLARLGPGLSGVFENSLCPALLGQPPEFVPRLEGAALRIYRPSRFENVRLASGYVPALVSGVVSDPQPALEDLLIAVAVNGKVRALTHPDPAPDGKTEFAALVPESVFREGTNAVEALAVDAGTALCGPAGAPDPDAIIYANSFEEPGRW